MSSECLGLYNGVMSASGGMCIHIIQFSIPETEANKTNASGMIVKLDPGPQDCKPLLLSKVIPDETGLF